MTTHHDIFLAPAHPVDQLVRDISHSCGVPLRPIESGVVDYAASLGHAAVEVELSHEYVDIDDIPFESYESFFTVRDFDSNLQREEATARQIFRNLASLNRYSLMLVLDLQHLLESSTPTSGTSEHA